MLVYLLLLSIFLQTPNCGCEDKPQINVLAVVNGFKITKQDLSIDTKSQVTLAQDAVIAARSQELGRQINNLLLRTEAKRRGLTAAKLLELEVSAMVTPPTEAEARAFYDQNKNRIAKDFKAVKNDIIVRLRSERETLRGAEFANMLRARAKITISDQPVTPPVSEADLSRVFATVNGVNITSHDIEQGLLPLIFKVQQQVYALRKQDLDLRINDYLLEEQAKRQGTTPKSLIDQNVRTKLPIISEEQARAFYNANKTRMNGDFPDLKAQIMQLLTEEAGRKLYLAYAEELRRGAAIQMYLTAPEPPNLQQLCCNPMH
jgi:hypothetical protein